LCGETKEYISIPGEIRLKELCLMNLKTICLLLKSIYYQPGNFKWKIMLIITEKAKNRTSSQQGKRAVLKNDHSRKNQHAAFRVVQKIFRLFLPGSKTSREILEINFWK
jgi:hypothetical protein